ncbi:hypothetical protein D9D17_19740 [Escherichia coli]|nr:hypothetical protein [Escherichia coli]
MDVTAKYELIGLMAYPIRHSLSPEMQNKALEKAGLPFTYMAFEVDNDSFPGAIEGLKALKMRGTGVSIDAPRDKCTLSCAINGIHAAFHYLKKNYISGCVMTVPTG